MTTASDERLPLRQVLAGRLLEHAAELVDDLTRMDREGIKAHWLDLAPAADMLLEALGIERLGIFTGNSMHVDTPAWGHRWTIGDRVVSVDAEHRWDRDVPLFRIRAAETSGGHREVSDG